VREVFTVQHTVREVFTAQHTVHEVFTAQHVVCEVGSLNCWSMSSQNYMKFHSQAHAQAKFHSDTKGLVD
jgi:hypothetical protein